MNHSVQQPASGLQLELCLSAVLLSASLFMALEFGRAFYVWNKLDALSQQGARLASMCSVDAVYAIRNSTVARAAALPGLQIDHIRVQYLDRQGDLLNDPVRRHSDIGFVRVAIENYQHPLALPFFDLQIAAPEFSTITTGESLGLHPPGSGAIGCAGEVSL
ncbi:TadE/TadG family type IV pilus assembly protein [Marinobacterium jannaschii]|uniref:TadE/TadG family type IV pilus assembly protein n=1 Tax=Marinobacterium jannaschii TaxID=64970 RepID=UPI00048353F5|nr:TadE/TadG family type IV pilus assembly protein [Marinobacterium jannaschii]